MPLHVSLKIVKTLVLGTAFLCSGGTEGFGKYVFCCNLELEAYHLRIWPYNSSGSSSCVRLARPQSQAARPSCLSMALKAQQVLVFVSIHFQCWCAQDKECLEPVWAPFEILFSLRRRTDCSTQMMDISLCLKRPSWLVDSKRVRMTSHIQWLLLTAVLLYLTNQVNSQKKVSASESEEMNWLQQSLLFRLGSDLESILDPSGCG